MNNYLYHTPGSPLSQSGRVGTGRAGRPLAYRAKFSIRPVADTNAGFKQINVQPEALQKVHSDYISRHELPPTLIPKNARPRVIQDMTNRNISRGWRKPIDGRK